MQRHETVTGMSDGSAEDTQVIEIGDGAGAEPSGNRHWPWIAALVSGAVLLVHAELPAELLPPSGDPRSHATWLASRPRRSEDAAIAMMIRLAREYGKIFGFTGL